MRAQLSNGKKYYECIQRALEKWWEMKIKWWRAQTYTRQNCTKKKSLLFFFVAAVDEITKLLNKIYILFTFASNWNFRLNNVCVFSLPHAYSIPRQNRVNDNGIVCFVRKMKCNCLNWSNLNIFTATLIIWQHKRKEICYFKQAKKKHTNYSIISFDRSTVNTKLDVDLQWKCTVSVFVGLWSHLATFEPTHFFIYFYIHFAFYCFIAFHILNNSIKKMVVVLKIVLWKGHKKTFTLRWNRFSIV